MPENLYLEVTDACTHACMTCPHGAQHPDRKVYFTPVEEIITTVEEAMARKGVASITISGGEPLMHPNIVEIVSRLSGMGLQITMLTNLYQLVRRGLAEPLAAAAPRMSIVTALHSTDAAVHDGITGRPGSHEAALAGIDALYKLRMNVVVKVILSVETCKALPAIFDMIVSRWQRGVQLNLCGLDLCGTAPSNLDLVPVNYKLEGELLESFLDKAEKYYGDSMHRFITLSEYPLCWIDPYFWKLSRNGSSRMTAYIDGDRMSTSDWLRPESTCDHHPQGCRECIAAPLCPGVWHSVYRIYGSSVVRPYDKSGHPRMTE